MTEDTEAPVDPTLLERLTSAGISLDRAPGMIERGEIRVAGERVTNPARVVPRGVPWVVNPA